MRVDEGERAVVVGDRRQTGVGGAVAAMDAAVRSVEIGFLDEGVAGPRDGAGLESVRGSVLQ
jgi:hypothetical protein